MDINELGGKVVNAAFRVHKKLGPGLLESAYEGCLLYELKKEGVGARAQCQMPVVYDEVEIECGYRLDILVEESIIIEIKAVAEILPVHRAQLITYLKLSGKRLGFLINFNTPRFKNGIKRFVNKM